VRVAIDAMVLCERDTGVGVWLRGLIRWLGRVGGGHEYLVYHGLDSGPMPEGEGSGVRCVRVRVPNRIRSLRIAWQQGALPQRLAADRVDVLHAPAYVLPLRARVPTVLTLHDLFALTHPWLCRRLNLLHFGLLMPPSVRLAGAIHCTSGWTRSMLLRRFPGAAPKAHVVEPGVDEFFRPGQDEEEAGRVLARLGLRDRPFLFVGNQEPKKGLPVLLRALALLRARHGARRKLLMVGGAGPSARRVAELIGLLDLQGQVVRTGYVARSRLPGIYRAALALVFPSLCEGFGIPPLEAMACGTPVIASDACGLRESVGDAAISVPAGDVEALAGAMRRVDADAELRAGLRREGLRRAERFSWQQKARRMVRLYELAAGGG